MTSNGLPTIAEKLSAVACYRLGSTRISRTCQKPDHNSIVVGLSLWYGVILDYNLRFSTEKAETNRGRIINHALVGWNQQEGDLTSFLTFLDQIADVLLACLSDPDGFKACLLLKGVKDLRVAHWLNPIKGSLLVLFSDAFRPDGEDEVQGIRMVRQVSCFLKKLNVDRPDLRDEAERDFFLFEEELSRIVPLRSCHVGYQRDVFDMKNLLMSHLDKFSLSPFVPGHGPGAVANPRVKCWYDKHTHACSDRRIGFLLNHAGLGLQRDYLPLIREDKSNRTSRYVCVPKTWKKLRGISAEPIELQYVQQGLLGAIDRMFTTDRWWASRINLHDQQASRDLARKGSVDGTLATIDLSAASDSVTLQLVRDLFGSTELARWLIGSRSTHTLCGDTTVKLNKFAPMGSACCFPVECIVFCLAAEVAVSRTRQPFHKVKQVRVFGDDIILPQYAVPVLFEILSNLGFSVNSDKSFWQGNFREACGTEAWHGNDIQPCRFQSHKSGVMGRYIDHDEISSTVAFANELFARGLHDTRKYLLELLFNKRVRMGNNKSVRVQGTIFSSFSGECQTLTSPRPTNFNLERKFSRPLQTLVYRRIVWQERPRTRILDEAMADSYDMCEYVTWLIRHQPGFRDYDALWSEGWINSTVSNPWSRLPLGVRMVPTQKWVIPSTRDFLE